MLNAYNNIKGTQLGPIIKKKWRQQSGCLSKCINFLLSTLRHYVQLGFCFVSLVFLLIRFKCGALIYLSSSGSCSFSCYYPFPLQATCK